MIYLPCWPFSLQSFLLFLPKIRGVMPGELSRKHDIFTHENNVFSKVKRSTLLWSHDELHLSH